MTWCSVLYLWHLLFENYALGRKPTAWCILSGLTTIPSLCLSPYEPQHFPTHRSPACMMFLGTLPIYSNGWQITTAEWDYRIGTILCISGCICGARICAVSQLVLQSAST